MSPCATRANYFVVTTTHTRRHGCHNHVVRSAGVAEVKTWHGALASFAIVERQRGGHNGG